MTDVQSETAPVETDAAQAADTPEAAAGPEAAPQHGVGPFSIREVALAGVWFVAFVVSFFSVSAIRFDSVWTSGIGWILTIGVPTVAVFLLVLRRLSPQGIRRVGSLGIDQFASVAFAVSATVWLTWTWETVAFVVDGGPWIRTWVMWVELVLMAAGVVLTVVAPVLPVLGEDFRHRAEIPAHRSARPLRPVTPRPVAAAPVPTAGGADVPVPDAAGTGEIEPAAVDAAPETAVSVQETVAQPRVQAFWALVPEERDVVDETGVPLYRIGPTAWALVIEDRGHLFVMRHEDGRIGYLHDVTGVTRG